MLRESQNRIKSMALIHQTLYESKDFVQVDFSNFLDTLAPTLVSSYGVDTDRISLAIDAVEVQLPIHAAIPCGLVVNELISNALKHAFPDGRRGEITINLAAGYRRVTRVLSVSDNGVGIAEDFDLAQTDDARACSWSRCWPINSAASSKSSASNPTRFILRFPVSR